MFNPETIPETDKYKLTLIIEGREIIIETGTLVRTMDTCADAFSCTMPWEPGLDPEIDKITSPYGYQSAAIYIGGELQLDGILYDVEQALTNEGRQKKLEIFSKSANVIDSSLRYPFEENNIDLYRRCVSQMNSPVAGRKFNIDVLIDIGVDIGGKFSRVEGEATDNCFEHLVNLASQRGCLISCDNRGNLLITKAKTKEIPVGTIQETEGLTPSFSTKFSGRSRFQKYEAISNTNKSEKPKQRQTASDDIVTQPRFLTFSASDSLPGECKNAAEWQKNKSAADALDLSFPVNDWYAPNKKLWIPNSNVTVISPTIGLKNGFTFLISRVEFVYTVSGLTANLQLKPPSVYSGEEITEPWLE